MHGKRGNPDEHAKLTEAGFQMTSDTIGDTYYVGPHNFLVWLFEDGTWRSYPEYPCEGSLDAYLAHIEASLPVF